ncbi:hypothetical protein, partial [Stenotrophomonas maltophilia]|uniref:hypothetical protein n=1 Tax=Stenotrophomonas maltophilia TaxID=40324 RepID=UPI0019538383
QMAAENKVNFGPRRSVGAFDARAQRNPSGRIEVRYRNRGDTAETAVSVSPDDAERLAAALVAAARDARGLG